MSSQDFIKINQLEHYAEIEFSSSNANSLTGNQLNELALVIQNAAKNHHNKALLLKSSGSKAFCAGANFDELSKLASLEAGQEFFSGFAKVILSILHAPIFVLARVQGKAVGGGVGVIAACDYAVADQSAAVALTELKIGLGPYVIGPVVERKIGKSAFHELAYTSDFRTASWCLAKGLYQYVCNDSSELDSTCLNLVNTWTSFDRTAIEKLKSVNNTDTLNWQATLAERAKISAELTLSEVVQTRIKALLK